MPAPKIPYRPFNPGEQVNNADGSYSTERTRTVRVGDGWINVPSLWMGPNNQPADLAPMSDDFLSTFATHYENQTGSKWLRFKSIDEAVAAAKARSAQGGAGAPQSRYQISQ